MASPKATWTRHVKMAKISNHSKHTDSVSSSNYSSYLPSVYTGLNNRVDRYRQYDQMDQDPEISNGLDIIADFCTQNLDEMMSSFEIRYKDHMGDSEIRTISDRRESWSKLNDFKTRTFDIFRNVLKYGDQFFIRDPETYEWHWVDPYNVEKITINESLGKKPIIYFVKDVALNLKDKVVTNTMATNSHAVYPGSLPNTMSAGKQYGSIGGGSSNTTEPFKRGTTETTAVDADHIIHISLSSGMDQFAPFGVSILENIFKTYKQKELLEDSIIIYRVQRAPERRVFKIDTGDLPPNIAMQHVERVKNSIHQRRIPNAKGGSTSLMDAAYNPMCLDMDTRIPLLDGRVLTIRELATEYQAGKENWVYSCHPVTGDIVPGNITWAGVTRQGAKVIKIHLDNGESIICTPDHKIPVLGYGFKEAKDLTVDDSLISFVRDYQSLVSNSTDRTYERVYNHTTNEFEYTHRMVAGYFREIDKHQEFTYSPKNAGLRKNVVHHKDFNRYNNDPRNLAWMNHTDHFEYHRDHRADMWANMSDEEYNRISSKISNSLKTRFISLDPQQKDKMRSHMVNVQKRALQWRKDNPQAYKDAVSPIRKKYIQDNPEFKDMLLDNLSEQMNKPWPNVEISYTREMLNRIVKLMVDNNEYRRVPVIKLCNQDEYLIELFKSANPTKIGISKIDTDTFGYYKLDGIIREFGYKNWKEFAKAIPSYNHKIVRIEYLDDPMDVGTITVDGPERWHNFHTFATEAGVFVKNSILEDYFFPQTSDGRGSSVETLPGGENLGQIDDLKWFNNKLIRGLKIPSSYLPFGPDESNAIFNDGKMGQALIQELKFNNYCQRLQNVVCKLFDTEFKKYMIDEGYNINTGSFDLVFRPPTNFAAYRKAEMESSLINAYSKLTEIPFIAKQTVLKKMGWTPEDITENERLWLQENPKKTKAGGGDPVALGSDLGSDMDTAGLQSVGVPDPDELDAGTDIPDGNAAPVGGESFT